MRKILLPFIIYLIIFSSYSFGDIYPTPMNLNVTTSVPDTIKITWEAPTPPEFGEGFESGIVPPVGWGTDTTNVNYTWQIMDNSDYVYSGSYAACIPWTDTAGVFLSFDSTKIENGSFNNWIDTTEVIPDGWEKSHSSLIIDSLSQDSLFLAISASSQGRYLYQTFSVSKYAQYRLRFRSKQDSIVADSKYKIEFYDDTNHKSLFVKDDLCNFEWQNYEFDVHTSSCNSIKIKLFPSNKGDSIRTYWDDIKFEKYKYEPNQDEWLISPEYIVKSGDELTFWLGTSKTYGINSPVFVLLSKDGGNSWNDTLIVCDGMDNDDDYWEGKEYSKSLSSLVGDSIQIAFRYLGGNGDLVCLDDVSIGGQKQDLTNFFVVPIKSPKVKFSSRAPLSKGGRGPILSGYKLYRKMFHVGEFYEITDTIITDTTVILDTAFIDTDVCKDTVYIYRVKAIYNGNIPSTEYSNSDTGYVFDNHPPTSPYSIEGTFYNLTTSEGNFKLTWESDTAWVSPSADIRRFKIYDDYGDSLFDSLEVNVENTEYEMKRDFLPTRPFQFFITSEDFAGNESIPTPILKILPPPRLEKCETNISSLEHKIKLTISKYSLDPCSAADSIKIYKSISEEDSTFFLLTKLKEEDITDGNGIYIDTLVTNGIDYYYYSTFTYDFLGESIHSYKASLAPDFEICGIQNIDIDSTDTSVIFSWDEPNDPDYAGVYVYTDKGYPNFPLDTLFVGTTTYEATKPGIFDFYFVSFDYWGNKDLDTEVKEEDIIIGLQGFTENFENGLPPTWDIEGTGEWYVSNDGSSQWFPIPFGDGQYAWINDDSLGQFGDTTNCYLIMPSVTELNDSDKVYLMFDSYFKKENDGSAYISLKTGNSWDNVVDITENIGNLLWELNVINLSSYIDFSIIDTLYIAFHYNDNGTWSQGWAIDNVSLLSTSQLKTLLGKKFSPDTKFYLYANYPNPFRNFTNFSFFLAEPSRVSLEIYNILGQRIATIRNNEPFGKGQQNLLWNGTDSNGKKVATGIYLYKMSVNNKSKINKLMLIR